MRTPARILIATLISLCCWEAWEGLRVFPDSWGDLTGANYTDHFSHMNAARLFPRVGLDTWRVPVDKMFPRLTPEQLAREPADLRAGGSYSGGVFEVDGWPAGKPLATSWSNNPRNYPPGDMLLVSPVAAAYHDTDLSFAGANRLLLMLFLLYAHVALYAMFTSLLLPRTRTRTDDRWLARMQALTAAVVYVEVIHWTLEGFYDAAALAPLVLCARFVQQRRGLAAIVAFDVAAFIHFRTFFFAPWVIYALAMIVREQQWRQWRIVDWLALLVASALGAMSLGVFVILWPSLQNLPIHNYIHPGNDPAWAALLLLPLFAIGIAVAARALWKVRAWLDLAVLGWLTVMMLALHEAYPWHMLLAVMPWLCAPPSVTAPADAVRVHVVRLAVLVGSIAMVFRFEAFSITHLWPL